MAKAKPEQGRIVLAEVLDQQGRHPKVRPLVIISRTDEIQLAQPFWCAAITGTLPNKLTSEYVLLRHGNGSRHPRTGLKKRCAVKCDWLEEIDESVIVEYIGMVSTAELSSILRATEESTQS